MWDFGEISMKTATIHGKSNGTPNGSAELKQKGELKDLVMTVDTVLHGDQHFNRIIGLDSPSCPGQRRHNLTIRGGSLKAERGIEAYSLDVEGDITAESIDSWRVTAKNITVGREMRLRELHCDGKVICGSLVTSNNGYELILRSPDKFGREVTCDSLITNRGLYDVLLRDL